MFLKQPLIGDNSTTVSHAKAARAPAAAEVAWGLTGEVHAIS